MRAFRIMSRNGKAMSRRCSRPVEPRHFGATPKYRGGLRALRTELFGKCQFESDLCAPISLVFHMQPRD
jgi:hypothetical protein